MKTHKRKVVRGLVFSNDRKILVGKSKGSDIWELPGGGIKEGESPAQALVREMLEETGLDIMEAHGELIDDKGQSEIIKKINNKKIKVISEISTFKVVFDQSSSEPTLKPGGDMSVLKWFSMSEVSKLQLDSYTKDLFLKLMSQVLLGSL